MVGCVNLPRCGFVTQSISKSTDGQGSLFKGSVVRSAAAAGKAGKDEELGNNMAGVKEGSRSSYGKLAEILEPITGA